MSSKIVLIIDDDEDDRFLLRKAIEKKIEGIAIVEANGGHQALKYLEASTTRIDTVDLLIVDMNMPEMDGLEALDRIRSLLNPIHIPVVMFSTSSDPVLVQKAYSAGINSYIKKPFSFEEYENIVNALYTCFLTTNS